MKRLVLWLAVSIITTVIAQSQETAQLQFAPKSFKEVKGSIGNMSGQFIKNWPKDVNGEEYTALIRVKVEQMPISEAYKLKFRVLGGNSSISRQDASYLASHNEWYIFVTAVSGVNLEAQHEMYGTSSRYPIEIKLAPKGVYEICLRNNKTTTISISSIPSGVTVFLDNRQIGATPVQPANISYGKHILSFSKAGKLLGNDTIEVSDGNISFDKYDFRQRTTVLLESDPSGADIYIDNEKTPKGRTPIRVELPHGLHKIVAVISSDKRDTLPVTIDEKSTEIMLHPVKKKTVELYASYQGKRVNARLDVSRLDGSYTVNEKEIREAKPAYHLSLPYGRYKFRMSYAGNYKERKETVRKNSKSVYEFPIKAKNSFVWPWQRKYDATPGGFSLGYVSKQLVTKGEGEMRKENGVWDDGRNKSLQGFQAGLHFQPCFSFGLGAYFGLFYEFYISKNDNYDYNRFMEHCLYIPVHGYYRIPFSNKIALSLHGGLGFNYSVYGAYSNTDEDVENFTDFYGEDAFPKRFNMAAEIGAGLRFGPVQLNAQYSKGITNHKSYESLGNYKTVQNKLSFSISYVFSGE